MGELGLCYCTGGSLSLSSLRRWKTLFEYSGALMTCGEGTKSDCPSHFILGFDFKPTRMNDSSKLASIGKWGLAQTEFWRLW